MTPGLHTIARQPQCIVRPGHEIRPERVPSWMLAGLRGLADPETAADPMHDMTHPANDGELEN